MISSPVKNGLYPVWAVFLLWAARCTSTITAYNLEDNQRWRRSLFDLIQYVFYVCIVGDLLAPTRNRGLFDHFKPVSTVRYKQQPLVTASASLSAVLFYTNVVRVIAGWMVTNSVPSKFVADHMRDQAKATTLAATGDDGSSAAEGLFDPTTMKGYRYLVVWPPHQEGRLGPATYIFTPRKAFSCRIIGPITIDKIWRIIGTDDGCSKVKDVCLSFALSHLLKRRFFEMECAEAKSPETRAFVLQGLLPEEEAASNYARAFHIIEVMLYATSNWATVSLACLHTRVGIGKNRWASHLLLSDAPCSSFRFICPTTLCILTSSPELFARLCSTPALGC
ncbi:hypothetical protein BS78_04G312100 [Paspalum vaginatum]|nr:hypothetical protein BS78_04G312100 [Paspalum vaginatum]